MLNTSRYAIHSAELRLSSSVQPPSKTAMFYAADEEGAFLIIFLETYVLMGI
jgi:hypothetical protein